MTRCGGALIGLLMAGCQVVVGVHGDAHERAADAGSTDTDALPDSGPVQCILPSAGDARVRLAMMLPTQARWKACLRRAGGQATSPLSAPGCPQSLGYRDVTAAFGVASGDYDITFVDDGADCTATPHAKLHTTIPANARYTLALLGDSPETAAIEAYAESLPDPDATISRMRLVHAAARVGALDLSLVSAPTLPATSVGVAASNVTYRHTAKPGDVSKFGMVDANGYVPFYSPVSTLFLGVGDTGSPDARAVRSLKARQNGTYTTWALGRLDDARFPFELYICDEQAVDGPFTRCGVAPATSLTIDTYNTQLNGSFAIAERVRRPAIIEAIAKLDSDVACVTEVWDPADRKAIVEAAKAHFPYSVALSSNFTTPLADARTLDGTVPKVPTTPPCTGADVATLRTLETCLETHCASGGTIIDSASDCMTNFCVAEAGALLFGDEKQHACWNCALTDLMDREPLSDLEAKCASPGAQPLPFAYGGENGAIMLSRHPIEKSELFMLPASLFAVGVQKGTLVLNGGARLDAYCTVLTTPVTGPTRPYSGLYGGVDPMTNDVAWRNELLLQTRRLGELVAKHSGGQPAVVTGELYAGGAFPPDISARNPEAFAELSRWFGLALGPSVTPKCTFCSSNPLVTPPGELPSLASSWSSLVLLSQIPVSETISNAWFLDQPVVTYGTHQVPPSPYHAARFVVHVR